MWRNKENGERNDEQTGGTHREVAKLMCWKVRTTRILEQSHIARSNKGSIAYLSRSSVISFSFRVNHLTTNTARLPSSLRARSGKRVHQRAGSYLAYKDHLFSSTNPTSAFSARLSLPSPLRCGPHRLAMLFTRQTSTRRVSASPSTKELCCAVETADRAYTSTAQPYRARNRQAA